MSKTYVCEFTYTYTYTHTSRRQYVHTIHTHLITYTGKLTTCKHGKAPNVRTLRDKLSALPGVCGHPTWRLRTSFAKKLPIPTRVRTEVILQPGL